MTPRVEVNTTGRGELWASCDFRTCTVSVHPYGGESVIVSWFAADAITRTQVHAPIARVIDVVATLVGALGYGPNRETVAAGIAECHRAIATAGETPLDRMRRERDEAVEALEALQRAQSTEVDDVPAF